MRIIKIDGNCNLCNGFIRLIYKSNNTRFYYAMFSEEDEKFAVEYSVNNVTYYGSEAILNILKDTESTFLGLLARLLSLLPSKIVMSLYKYVALRRYRFFGRKDVCSIADQIPRKYRL